MTLYRPGDRVRLRKLINEYAQFNGRVAVIVRAIDRGSETCGLYDVQLVTGSNRVWILCDCYLEPELRAPIPPIPPTFYITVAWDAMPWRPNLSRLPEYISAELNRRRRSR